MHRSPLPLLMGAVIGTQALLNGVSLVLPPKAHSALDHFAKATTFISSAHAEEAAAVKYTCPMHPQIISDRPGKCPICGMDLVPIAASGHTHDMSLPPQIGTQAVQDQSGRKVLYWYDPMKPEQHFDKPGKSPFMDMQLVPKYAGEVSAPQSGGKPVVSISAEELQKMGVRTAKAERSALGGGLRTTGIVMENERTRHDLFSQVEGRVEDLQYSAEGDLVNKGEVIYTLVSPDLATLQNDYIAALAAGLKDMASAAAKRMKLLGIDDQVIAALAKTRKAYDSVPFYVPANGVLTKLAVRNGAYLKAGDMVGQIQDLSTVWVEAAVPEGELASVKEGDKASVTFTGDAESYEAKVDYVYPTIDAEARTGKVRLVLDNKDDALKPAGYATVTFTSAVPAGEALTVPSEAILHGSDGDHVIVALGGGKFQARDVKTGTASGSRTEILSGLKEDEEVVVSAQFLIDSESSLEEALQKLSATETPKQNMPPVGKAHGQ